MLMVLVNARFVRYRVPSTLYVQVKKYNTLYYLYTTIVYIYIYIIYIICTLRWNALHRRMKYIIKLVIFLGKFSYHLPRPFRFLVNLLGLFFAFVHELLWHAKKYYNKYSDRDVLPRW